MQWKAKTKLKQVRKKGLYTPYQRSLLYPDKTCKISSALKKIPPSDEYYFYDDLISCVPPRRENDPRERGCHTPKSDAGEVILDSFRSEILRNLPRLHPNKKIVIFFWGDQTNPIHVRTESNPDEHILYENAILFRPSFYASKKFEFERLFPWFESNLFDFKPVIPQEAPSVGFCGAATDTWRLARRRRGGRFHFERTEIINVFKNTTDIQTNAIIRPIYYRETIRRRHPDWRTQYLNNLQNNIFNICYRGAGNFSLRFYEVLSSGRIPIVVKSDSELPFENKIDWENTIILADTAEEAVEKTLFAWNNKDIVKMQIECKRIHREYFTEEGFLKHLHEML
jgi:hypothetical protein